MRIKQPDAPVTMTDTRRQIIELGATLALPVGPLLQKSFGLADRVRAVFCDDVPRFLACPGEGTADRAPKMRRNGYFVDILENQRE